jgi:hypothetical protein
MAGERKTDALLLEKENLPILRTHWRTHWQTRDWTNSSSPPALLAILEPHIKRAPALRKTLRTARMEGALLSQSVETVGLAIISVEEVFFGKRKRFSWSR